MISFCAFKTSVLLRRISRALQKLLHPDCYRDRDLVKNKKEISNDFFLCF